MDNKLLVAKDISKSFFLNKVLYDIDFSIDYGEILGLIGENGAGKSTLVKILTGVYKPDTGYIIFNGSKVDIENINVAKNLGIGIVFQELSLVDNLSVADNIFIGKIPSNKLGFIDKKKLYKITDRLIDKFKVDIKPYEIVGRLSIGNKQIVEILKAISSDPKLLILDEPTSSLEKNEKENLFKLIKELKNNNYSIIYISHYLDEVLNITDNILVLRDGKKVGVFKTNEVNKEELIKLMINKDIKEFFSVDSKLNKSNEVLLEVKNLSDNEILKNISFKLYKGEILGLVGLLGSGTINTCKAIFGLSKNISGEIFIKGKKISKISPIIAKNNKIAFIPEDRKAYGLYLNDNVTYNIISTILNRVSRLTFLSNKKIIGITTYFIKLLNIKISNIYQRVKYLSGGNQQKILISKSLAYDPEILIALDPTRGVDVGTKEDIHKILKEASEKGTGILLVSSELDEVINMSDRILVFVKGNITKVIDKKDFDNFQITLAINRSMDYGD